MQLRQITLTALVVAGFFGDCSGGLAAETDDIEKFLAQQERAGLAAQKRLLTAVSREAKRVRLSDLPPGEKQVALEAIERDRSALESEGKLPSADELLPAVIKVLNDYQKVVENLENFRHRHSDRTVRREDSEALKKVAALHERLNKIVGGRENFTGRSVWSGEFAKYVLGKRGKRIVSQTFNIRLTIDNVRGNEFSGTLRQKAGPATASLLSVAGRLDGNLVSFQTAEMIRGKDRSFAFTGYLLSDRIIARVNGIDAFGHAASGWMSLWREGAASGQ
jgi:hypothetical protein